MKSDPNLYVLHGKRPLYLLSYVDDFIVIGDEILSGRTKDKNIGWLAEQLGAQGIQLGEARVIADKKQPIIDTVQTLSKTYDLVFTSGGIGPTHDDITTDAVAAAFNVPVIRHPEAERRLIAHYANTDLEFNAARQKMANIPDTAALIDNPLSAAPGYIIGNVHVLPGVPTILQAMFEGLKIKFQKYNLVSPPPLRRLSHCSYACN
mgnify:CR=1 FL=1